MRMYNRYIPSADGTYQRKIVPSPRPKQPEPALPTPPPSPQRPPQAKEAVMPSFPKLQLDTGDILVLLILLLILTEGEDSDPLSLLITIGAFLFMK